MFCGSVGPLTDEHALPKWARKAIGATGAPAKLHVARAGSGRFSMPTGSPLRTFTGMTVKADKAVCNQCNTGWMAGLERELEPLLAPAMRGEAIHLSAQQQMLVAFWAVKTGLTVEVAARQARGAGIMPISHLRWIHDHRASHEMPPGTVVWLASLNPWLGSEFVPTWYSSGALHSGDPRGHANRRNDSYVATFSIGCLIFQVIGQDFRESDHGTPNGLPFVTVIPPRKLAPYLLQIWPKLNPLANWPPNHHILAEEWPTFAEWFTVLSWFYKVESGTGDIAGVFLAENRRALRALLHDSPAPHGWHEGIERPSG